MKIPFESIGWNECPHFYGVIVHEDPPTELRGRRQWDQLVHKLGKGIRCSPTYQPAEQIKRSLIFEQAYLADAVIVSVHDLARFFFDAAEWLTDWLSVKPRLPRALFILHNGDEVGQAIEFLRQLAGLTGVTVFSRGHETNDGPQAGDPERDCQPVEHTALVFAETWFRSGAFRCFSRADRVGNNDGDTGRLMTRHDFAPLGEQLSDYRSFENENGFVKDAGAGNRRDHGVRG